jgi:hypothetical protein
MIAVVSGILSYYMFTRSAIPDYPDKYPAGTEPVYDYGPH